MFKRFGAKRQKSWQRQKRLRSGEGRGRLARRARRNRSLRTVTTRRVSSGFREATKEKTGRLARRARCHKRIRILKKEVNLERFGAKRPILSGRRKGRAPYRASPLQQEPSRFQGANSVKRFGAKRQILSGRRKGRAPYRASPLQQ